nr:hypothetical protein [Tanacetum cinerariifolium]
MILLMTNPKMNILRRQARLRKFLRLLFEAEELGEIKGSVMKESKHEEMEEAHSEDPFNIYDKQQLNHNVSIQSEGDPKYPSGFLPHKSDGLVMKNETKMKHVNLFDIKSCWGNLSFDFVVGPSLGNSGGILCVWDSNMFHKEISTVSDYVIAIMGKWLPNDKNYLIISIYAPQELSEKKMLWQYLVHVIGGWNGNVIVMGDFNKVLTEAERFGSTFNARGVAAFNSFISTGGLVEVPSGFDSFVSEAWKEIKIQEYNVMLKLAKKLKILKEKIRSWVKDKKEKAHVLKNSLKKKLVDIDSVLDTGKVTSNVLEDRLDAMNSLTKLEKMESIELAQEAKIKWSIVGDENSKYFHGIINKKQNNLAIQGIIVDGVWIEDPSVVKNEFLSHLRNRFDSPCTDRLTLDMEFPNVCLTNKTPMVLLLDKFWSLLEVDVVDAVYYFFNNGLCLKGLRINLQKCGLMGIDVETNKVDTAANNLGCSVLKSRFSYLGVNIGGHITRINYWDVIINKILSQLSKWKMKVLSIGGRLTLLKSVLGATPIYYMSMFKAPIQKKCPCVYGEGWSKSFYFYALNRTLIFKWVWRFRTNPNSLWSRAIMAIHGQDGKLEEIAHPSISFSFRRDPRLGSELAQMASLQSHLEGIVLSNVLDRWIWSLSGDGEFSVSSVRNLIDNKTLGTVGSKTQRCKFVPIKVNILSWRVKLKNLPTRLNLSRRGMELHFILCPSCNIAVESTNHLFFACPMMKNLYKAIT